MEPFERALNEQPPLDLTSGGQPAPGSENGGGAEPGPQLPPPIPPTEQAPWNPGNFKWIAFLVSFLASGILAGLNWRRLGKPQRMWPTILASIGGTAVFVAVLILLPDNSSGFKFFGYAVNIGVGYLLSRWQQPAYDAYNLTYRDSAVKGSGLRIPVLVSLGSVVVIVAMSYGLSAAWDQIQYGHYYQGNTYLDQENYSQAIDEYNQAAAVAPNVWQIYVNRGVAHFNLNDLQRALADFNQAIQINPKIEVAYRDRSVVNLNLEKYDAALNDINDAISFDSSIAKSFYMRGLIYSKTNETDKAIADLEKAIQMGLEGATKTNADSQLQRLKLASQDSTPAAPIPVSSKQYASAPLMTIDKTKLYLATVKMANGGQFIIQLFPNKAPVTVNNFIFLAREGFFNGTTFHRVIENFMAQGGDPSGTGTGGPGYTFANEYSDLKFDKSGVVAMANTGPDTNGSQFFITFVPIPSLDSGYTIFGQVISGMDVVNGLTRRDPNQNPTFQGDVIESITISK